jgi:thymidylate synthase ThyX
MTMPRKKRYVKRINCESERHDRHGHVGASSNEEFLFSSSVWEIKKVIMKSEHAFEPDCKKRTALLKGK